MNRVPAPLTQFTSGLPQHLNTKSRTFLTRNFFFLLCFLAAISSCRKAETQIELPVTVGDRAISNTNMSIMALPSNGFKVMSFNVRHNDPGDPQTLTERQANIKQIIVDNSPDLVGLQEFSNASFKTWFTTQMTGLGYAATDTEGEGSPKIIFYKTSRFTLMSDDVFELEDDPSTAQNATWAIFRDDNNAKQYFVCNSHWSSVSQTLRIQDSESLVSKMLSANTGGLPLIVFGDFNAKPNTTEINYLKSNLGLVDALGDELGDPTFHNWGASANKIDWMMSNVRMAYHSPAVITTKYGGYWPSDHYPVMATYVPAIFGEPTMDPNGTSASQHTIFNFADVNGDGKVDKIYWNYTADSGKPAVYLSDGDGTFTFASKITGAASTLTTTKYNYADVNGDGKADAIVWNPAEFSGHTRVFLATSAGNFSTTAIENPENGSATASTIYKFADVNGDGKADKIRWTSSYDSGKTRINLATSGGSFSGTTIADAVGATTTADVDFYYQDMNADGKADKILWHSTINSGKPMVYLSDGDGTFTASSTFSSTGAGGTAATTQFYFADINGDSRADKIYWNPANFLGQLKVYYATSSNAFENTPVYTLRGISENTNTKFYFFDINGDASHKADQIRWNYTQDSGQLRNYFAN